MRFEWLPQTTRSCTYLNSEAQTYGCIGRARGPAVAKTLLPEEKRPVSRARAGHLLPAKPAPVALGVALEPQQPTERAGPKTCLDERATSGQKAVHRKAARRGTMRQNQARSAKSENEVSPKGETAGDASARDDTAARVKAHIRKALVSLAAKEKKVGPS
jgi:hypothetical protein